MPTGRVRRGGQAALADSARSAPWSQPTIDLGSRSRVGKSRCGRPASVPLWGRCREDSPTLSGTCEPLLRGARLHGAARSIRKGL